MSDLLTSELFQSRVQNNKALRQTAVPLETRPTVCFPKHLKSSKDRKRKSVFHTSAFRWSALKTHAEPVSVLWKKQSESESDDSRLPQTEMI